MAFRPAASLLRRLWRGKRPQVRTGQSAEASVPNLNEMSYSPPVCIGHMFPFTGGVHAAHSERTKQAACTPQARHTDSSEVLPFGKPTIPAIPLKKPRIC